jgi:ABC-2 type transport system permease protein
MWVFLWMPTTIYVWLTSRYGSLDLGAIGSSYIGVLAMGIAMVSIGLLASTIARTQLTAFLLAFVMIAGIFMFGIFTFSLPEGTVREVANYMSFWEQSTTFARGIVDSRYLVFDATLATISLFISHRILVARRLA